MNASLHAADCPSTGSEPLEPATITHAATATNAATGAPADADTGTDTAPLPARGLTPQKRVMFLDRMARHGNARAACEAVGMSREAAYRLRRRDPLFARGWAAAVLLGHEHSEQVVTERALDGVEEEVWFRDQIVGTRRRYDTRLLLAHMARLDALVKASRRGQSGRDAAQFDRLLAQIGRGASEFAAQDREQYIRQAGADAGHDAREARLVAAEDAAAAGVRDVIYAGELDAVYREAERRAHESAAARWQRMLASDQAEVDAACEAAVTERCSEIATEYYDSQAAEAECGANSPPDGCGEPGGEMEDAASADAAASRTPQPDPAFPARSSPQASPCASESRPSEPWASEPWASASSTPAEPRSAVAQTPPRTVSTVSTSRAPATGEAPLGSATDAACAAIVDGADAAAQDKLAAGAAPPCAPPSSCSSSRSSLSSPPQQPSHTRSAEEQAAEMMPGTKFRSTG